MNLTNRYINTPTFDMLASVQAHKKYQEGESLSDFELELLIVLYRELSFLLEIASPPYNIARDCAYRTLEELHKMSSAMYGSK